VSGQDGAVDNAQPGFDGEIVGIDALGRLNQFGFLIAAAAVWGARGGRHRRALESQRAQRRCDVNARVLAFGASLRAHA